MAFDTHINNICRQCYFHLHNIGSIRPSLTSAAAEKIIHAFVSSKIDNCNSLLHALPKKSLHKLQRVQNMAARIVLRAPKRESVTGMLKELHWLPVEQRIHYKIATLTWKCINNRAPLYLKELTEIYTPTRALRSSNELLLVKHVPKTNYAARSFKCAAPNIWNSLPSSLRSVQSYETFKKHLKTYLFTCAF